MFYVFHVVFFSSSFSEGEINLFLLVYFLHFFPYILKLKNVMQLNSIICSFAFIVLLPASTQCFRYTLWQNVFHIRVQYRLQSTEYTQDIHFIFINSINGFVSWFWIHNNRHVYAYSKVMVTIYKCMQGTWAIRMWLLFSVAIVVGRSLIRFVHVDFIYIVRSSFFFLPSFGSTFLWWINVKWNRNDIICTK